MDWLNNWNRTYALGITLLFAYIIIVPVLSIIINKYIYCIPEYTYRYIKIQQSIYQRHSYWLYVLIEHLIITCLLYVTTYYKNIKSFILEQTKNLEPECGFRWEDTSRVEINTLPSKMEFFELELLGLDHPFYSMGKSSWIHLRRRGSCERLWETATG